MNQLSNLHPDLRTFIDRVVVPALIERFLRDQAAGTSPPVRPAA